MKISPWKPALYNTNQQHHKTSSQDNKQLGKRHCPDYKLPKPYILENAIKLSQDTFYREKAYYIADNEVLVNYL